MAGGKSTYLSDGVLAVLRGTAFPLAATGSVYVALGTAAWDDAGSGTEVSAGGYARQAVSKAAGSWSAPSGTGPRTMSNAGAITFGSASASWGTVTNVAIFDALTGGNMLYTGALTASKAIASGDSASFAAGALVLSEE